MFTHFAQQINKNLTRGGARPLSQCANCVARQGSCLFVFLNIGATILCTLFFNLANWTQMCSGIIISANSLSKYLKKIHNYGINLLKLLVYISETSLEQLECQLRYDWNRGTKMLAPFKLRIIKPLLNLCKWFNMIHCIGYDYFEYLSVSRKRRVLNWYNVFSIYIPQSFGNYCWFSYFNA